jgi:hypothetical protein
LHDPRELGGSTTFSASRLGDTLTATCAAIHGSLAETVSPTVNAAPTRGSPVAGTNVDLPPQDPGVELSAWKTSEADEPPLPPSSKIALTRARIAVPPVKAGSARMTDSPGGSSESV